MRRQIIGIVHESENNALLGASYDYGRAFDARGFQTEIIDLRAPDGFAHLYARVQDPDIAFAFGVQGIGGRLRGPQGEPLWQQAQIPFVGIHYDHPCYNPYNHTYDSPFIGYVYPFASFQRVKERYLPSSQLIRHIPFSLMEELPRIDRPFSARRTKLLYIKTGVSLAPMLAELRGLPGPLAELIRVQLARAEKDPNLELSDLVAEVYLALKVDRESFQLQFWDNVRLMDRYLRAARAIRFVDWLKKRPDAVIIGRGWDFIDRTDARAQFLSAVDISTLHQHYADARYICNTNPYGCDIFHERILAGLVFGCAVLSDGNAWLDQHFGDVPALLRFDWNRSLDDQILPFLDDEARAESFARQGHSAVMARLPKTQIDQILDFVQDLRLFAKRTTQI